MSRLYLFKNDLTENPKLPYFVLKLIPEEGDPSQDWKSIGAFWKTANGKGYSGKLSEGVTLDASGLKVFEKKASAEPTQEDIDAANAQFEGAD